MLQREEKQRILYENKVRIGERTSVCMTELLGAKAKERIEREVEARLAALHARGERVKIALFRVGESGDDVRYERTILRACERLGIEAKPHVFDASCTEQTLLKALSEAAGDDSVDGMLLFRPLPKAFSIERLQGAIPPQKDIDGMLAERSVFLPCTPDACMHLLRTYDIEVSKKHCVVIGRSPVVGKPLAKLLADAGADVTVCHTQTEDVPSETRKAEILFAACGKPRMVDRSYLSEGQVVVDIGFHATDSGVCGDVNAEDARALASAYTPVPGGVGAVTLSVLLLHAVAAHERMHG